MGKHSSEVKVARRSAADFFSSGPCRPSDDPVDQV